MLNRTEYLSDHINGGAPALHFALYLAQISIKSDSEFAVKYRKDIDFPGKILVS